MSTPKMRWNADQLVSPRLAELQDELQSLKEDVAAHQLYSSLLDDRSLRIFMSHHVFAVWDFMSIAKALQGALTCISTPWVPVATPAIRRFVNELILEEESDAHPVEGYTSHFELYLSAMKQRGVSTTCISTLVDLARSGISVPVAIENAGVPEGARNFVRETWTVVEEGDPAAVAAFFAFGRETLIPSMFSKALGDLAPATKPDLLEEYFVRHISLDGDTHGPMAMRILEWICGDDDDKWKVAELAGRRALESRISLWDGIVSAFQKQA